MEVMCLVYVLTFYFKQIPTECTCVTYALPHVIEHAHVERPPAEGTGGAGGGGAGGAVGASGGGVAGGGAPSVCVCVCLCINYNIYIYID